MIRTVYVTGDIFRHREELSQGNLGRNFSIELGSDARPTKRGLRSVIQESRVGEAQRAVGNDGPKSFGVGVVPEPIRLFGTPRQPPLMKSRAELLDLCLDFWIRRSELVVLPIDFVVSSHTPILAPRSRKGCDLDFPPAGSSAPRLRARAAEQWGGLHDHGCGSASLDLVLASSFAGPL